MGSLDRRDDPGFAASLFGAPLDTGNLGVSALGLSTLAAVARRHPGSHLTLFDNGRGRRPTSVALGEGRITVEQRGAWISRRFYRQESLWTMAACSRVPPALLPNLRAIDRAAVVLDVSGGDSFTDLYGGRRFDLVALPKEITLRRGRPLVLLPQTYGPFRAADRARRAARLILGASQAWARDADSYDRLRELAGADFDPARHRLGVDVAFALPAVDPGGSLGDLEAWLEASPPPVGVNVSGLLHNDPAAGDRFGLAADYPRAVDRLLHRLLDETDERILLVPHTRGGAAESDDHACAELVERIGRPDRVRTLPPGLDAPHLKWVIGRLGWFCGTRMHSTIAALSAGVPVSAIAYSGKTRGVFATCDLGDEVADARTLSTDDLADRLWSSYQRRDAVRGVLERNNPAVVEEAERQFDTILGVTHDRLGAEEVS